MSSTNILDQSKPSINRDQLITHGDLEDFKTQIFAEFILLLTELRAEPARAWLRSKEVKKMLNISSATLQSFRINRVLSYSMLGRILYYKYDEIIERLNKNVVSKNL